LEVLSGGFEERERWDDYMQYYEEAINNTSTDYAWYVIPADDKEMCRYIVGKIIWEEMQKILIFKRLKWMIKLKKT
jgi:polyphosphate kinase 2 (PPK2 family)